jgi:hypothetical protein
MPQYVFVSGVVEMFANRKIQELNPVCSKCTLVLHNLGWNVLAIMQVTLH